MSAGAGSCSAATRKSDAAHAATVPHMSHLLDRITRTLGGGLLALVIAATAPAAAALPASEDDLARVEGYLNELRSLRASFVQIAPDGGTATGRVYYQRPDKMRLDYDPPSRLEIIASGWQLVYHDRRLEQVSHLPVRRTPLAFLLQDQISLSGGGVEVTHAERDEEELRITVIQADQPDQGALTLVFGGEPVELRRWAVIDAQGLTTHVLLEEIETDVRLDRSLFVFRDPYIFQRRD
jgi:outer membrane lipoprotein-sorting protein